MAIQNDVKNINSQCQIVVFPWLNDVISENFSEADLIATKAPLDISKDIRDVAFSKNLAEPAGTFQITLPNNKDWKEIIRPGSWCLIYMSQNGGLAIPKGNAPVSISSLKSQKNKLRGICYIERVAPKGSVGGELGEFDVDFVISGRDFGVVYEETEIWHNLVFFERNLVDAATTFLNSASIKTVDKVVETIHGLFYSPEDFLKKDLKDKSLTKVSLQWLLPSAMLTALDIRLKRNSPFFGNIEGLLKFTPSKASYPVEDPLSLVTGNAWQRIKELSLEQFHELFTETDEEGHPRLVFRPIPWVLDPSNKDLGKLLTPSILFKNVARVPVSAIDILEFDIGEDNHNRYNLFFTTVKTSLFTVQDGIASMIDTDPRTGFPRIQQNSIRRHGLRLMYNEINSMIQFGQEKVDENLLKAYNHLMFEYWNNAVFYESGTMDIIGNNDIKLGKVLQVGKDAPYNANKLFYIEGYEDRFVVDDNGVGLWTQSLILTRGIDESDLRDGRVESRDTRYDDAGEFTEDN